MSGRPDEECDRDKDRHENQKGGKCCFQIAAMNVFAPLMRYFHAAYPRQKPEKQRTTNECGDRARREVFARGARKCLHDAVAEPEEKRSRKRRQRDDRRRSAGAASAHEGRGGKTDEAHQANR
ncbi:hypothetical protein D9M70_572620 [compost metagenome]